MSDPVQKLVSEPARFVFEVRHRTCGKVPWDDEAPEMFLERAEDDMGIYTCPKCHEKVSVLLFFQKGS